MEGNEGFVDTLGFLQPMPMVLRAAAGVTRVQVTPATGGRGKSASGTGTGAAVTRGSGQQQQRAVSGGKVSVMEGGDGDAAATELPRAVSLHGLARSSLPSAHTRQRLVDFTRAVLDSDAQGVGVAAHLGHVPATGRAVDDANGGDAYVVVCACVCERSV